MARPILDEETNFVYISDKLRVFFPEFHDALTEKFSEMHIHFGILHGTKDIWCRDYMPIQMNDMSFVGYKFDPDYLKENFGHSEYTEYESKYSPIGARLRPWERVSALSEISVSHGIDISSRLRNFNIVLDGGNLVFCGNYVIVTDKILKENKQSRDELESILREMFNLEPIIVHWEPDHEDVYGHTDGMFRALPTKKDEKPKLLYLHRWDSPSKRLRDNLRETAGDRIELKEIVFEKKGPGIDSLAWAYINFLQVGRKILVPKFGLADEDSVMDQFHSCFGIKPESIEMPDIARQGGALHCLTWNIKNENKRE